ncbi:hypothetical protein SADUNF_Sadunf18G0014900 [Salix dunnii]|uniref:Uncharacterized protein n=1 Tax=Salix dunnii TaxID=1413687 RepID=A0A835J2R3_9ROSI|nr:hypothetical protein SADUNF_Sadunf18G0014900 [Salix dunnii]
MKATRTTTTLSNNLHQPIESFFPLAFSKKLRALYVPLSPKSTLINKPTQASKSAIKTNPSSSSSSACRRIPRSQNKTMDSQIIYHGRDQSRPGSTSYGRLSAFIAQTLDLTLSICNHHLHKMLNQLTNPLVSSMIIRMWTLVTTTGNKRVRIKCIIIVLLAMYDILNISVNGLRKAELRFRVESHGEFFKEPEYEVAGARVGGFHILMAYMRVVQQIQGRTQVFTRALHTSASKAFKDLPWKERGDAEITAYDFY